MLTIIFAPALADRPAALYVHGAHVYAPHNDPHVTWDHSTDPAAPVWTIPVPDDDDATVRATLDRYGITVTGTTPDGWTGEQTRTL